MNKFLNRWKKPLAFTILLVGGLAVYAWAQDRRGWSGHMFFTQSSPQIRYDGTLSFQTLSGTTLFAIDSSTHVTKFATYLASITPSSFSNFNPLFTNLFTTQSFTVTGLTASDVVFVNGPAPTGACAVVGAKIPTTDTLVLNILHATTGACTPAAGVYQIVAIRT